MSTIIQIETNSNCNLKCWFCQNAHYKLNPTTHMSMTMFDNILKQLKTKYNDSLPSITFATYNEPTLDPLFKERMLSLKKFWFKFWFISNWTNINKTIVDFLIKENIELVWFTLNIPSLDQERFAKITNSKIKVDIIKENIDYLWSKNNELKTWLIITVNWNNDEEHDINFASVNNYFSSKWIPVSKNQVMDRAWMLKEWIPNNIDHWESKTICTANNFSNIYIWVKWNFFLCCHDYYQEFSYWNINKEPLEEILNSKIKSKVIDDFSKKFCRYCIYAKKV